MVTFMPASHEECSRRTVSRYSLGNMLNVFLGPSSPCHFPIPLKVVFTEITLFLFPLTFCLLFCIRKEEEKDYSELHSSSSFVPVS